MVVAGVAPVGHPVLERKGMQEVVVKGLLL